MSDRPEIEGAELPPPFEPTQFGRYLLVDRLAVGGMAEIFRAKTRGAHGFEKTLVIKRILPHLAVDREFTDMFIDEAKLMVRLTHPKVVQVLDFGELDGQYYMALEYVDGIDGLALLRQCASRRARPTTGIALHIVADVLDALAYAHGLKDQAGDSLGVIHRDISPSNIFISWLGEVKLGDFGIARAAVRRGHTEGGALKGKYGYMAPEQVSDSAVDSRADVFAVGVVLAELLMIRRLFYAKNDLEVLLQVRDARLDRLDRYGARIPPDLRAILESALARDPNMRYQTAAAFRDALHRYLFDHRRMVRSDDVRNFLMRLTEDDSPVDNVRPDSLELPSVSAPVATAANNEASAELGAGDDATPASLKDAPALAVPSAARAAKVNKAPASAPAPTPSAAARPEPDDRPERDRAQTVRRRARAAQPKQPAAKPRPEPQPKPAVRAAARPQDVAPEPEAPKPPAISEPPPLVIAPEKPPRGETPPVQSPNEQAAAQDAALFDAASSIDDGALEAAVDLAFDTVFGGDEDEAPPPPPPPPPSKPPPGFVGTKRRIVLTPPPMTLPPPLAAQHEQARRLASDEAIAAVPEMAISESSASAFGFGAVPPSSETEIPMGPPPENSLRPEAAVQARLSRSDETPASVGSLQDRTLFELLFGLAVAEDTGQLVVEQNSVSKEIFLVNGDPQYVTSSRADELFGQYLVSRGVLSKGELSMALAMLPHFNGKLGDTLVALKLLRPVEVLRHLTHQVRQKLLEAFTWSEGSYRFYPGKLCEHESAPLGLDAFEVIGAAVRALSWDWIKRRLEATMHEKLRSVSPAPVPPEVFRLGGVPRQVYDRLDGRFTLEQLLRRFDDAAQRRAFAQMVFLLVETGLAATV